MFFKNFHLSKVKSFSFKSKPVKEPLDYEELKAEFVGYKKQYVTRVKYIFKNGIATDCYIETESDNDIFFLLPEVNDGLRKNIKRGENILKYEWSDDYFLQKGKGCTKDEVERFLKKQKFKIKKRKDVTE